MKAAGAFNGLPRELATTCGGYSAGEQKEEGLEAYWLWASCLCSWSRILVCNRNVSSNCRNSASCSLMSWPSRGGSYEWKQPDDLGAAETPVTATPRYRLSRVLEEERL